MIKWIKCSDRLPPMGKSVLLCLKTANNKRVTVGTGHQWETAYANKETKYWWFSVCGSVFKHPTDQTYWAELNLPESST